MNRDHTVQGPSATLDHMQSFTYEHRCRAVNSKGKILIDIAHALGMPESTPGLAAPFGAGNLCSAEDP